MEVQTLDVVPLRKKNVLVFFDLDVPIEQWQISNIKKIQALKETLEFLIKKQTAQIHIIGTLGPANGKKNNHYSLRLVREAMKDLIGKNILFADNINADWSGAKIILHENLNFYPDELRNSPKFIHQLLRRTGAHIFVLDAVDQLENTNDEVLILMDQVRFLAGRRVEKNLLATDIKHLSETAERFVYSEQQKQEDHAKHIKNTALFTGMSLFIITFIFFVFWLVMNVFLGVGEKVGAHMESTTESMIPLYQSQ